MVKIYQPFIRCDYCKENQPSPYAVSLEVEFTYEPSVGNDFSGIIFPSDNRSVTSNLIQSSKSSEFFKQDDVN